MSHHVYTTLGFVIESHPHKEAGKFIYIFTRELGMVGATAQGIRFEKSKLRYYAQDFSLATFSLVRGKEMWRIVGAQDVLNQETPTPLKSGNDRYALYVRILKVLKRLIPGEEKHERLFDSIIAASTILRGEAVDPILAEPIIMLRILHHLGYVRASVDLNIFIKTESFEDSLFAAIKEPGIKAKIVREINTALKESQL